MKRMFISAPIVLALSSPSLKAEPAPIITLQQERLMTHEDAVAMVKTMKEINANLAAIRESIRKMSGESR